MRATARLGLCFLVAAACSPARGEPVGVSQGGKEEPWGREAGAAPQRAPLAGLPKDFRATLKPVLRVAKSEHLGGAPAVVWADEAGEAALTRGSAAPDKALFVEELGGPSVGDAGAVPVALYLLAIEGGTARFGAADAKGLATLDDEGKATSACARCHAESLRAPIWTGR